MPFSPPQSNIDQVAVHTLFHPDLFQPFEISGSTQVPPFRHPVLQLVSRPESLTDFQLLQANLGLQYAEELLNNMHNIVQQQNSHAI